MPLRRWSHGPTRSPSASLRSAPESRHERRQRFQRGEITGTVIAASRLRAVPCAHLSASSWHPRESVDNAISWSRAIRWTFAMCFPGHSWPTGLMTCPGISPVKPGEVCQLWPYRAMAWKAPEVRTFADYRLNYTLCSAPPSDPIYCRPAAIGLSSVTGRNACLTVNRPT